MPVKHKIIIILMSVIVGLLLFGLSSVLTYRSGEGFGNRGWPVSFKQYPSNYSSGDYPSNYSSGDIVHLPLCSGVDANTYKSLGCSPMFPIDSSNLIVDIIIWQAVGFVACFTYFNLHKKRR